MHSSGGARPVPHISQGRSCSLDSSSSQLCRARLGHLRLCALPPCAVDCAEPEADCERADESHDPCKQKVGQAMRGALRSIECAFLARRSSGRKAFRPAQRGCEGYVSHDCCERSHDQAADLDPPLPPAIGQRKRVARPEPQRCCEQRT